MVATIFPVADLAARVAGDAVRVETLLPPRASVHTWEATPGQVRALDRAAGFISVGGGLDAWLEALVGEDPTLRTLRLTDGLALRARVEEPGHLHRDDEGAGTGDPHVWLDPILVRDGLLPRITALLGDLAPEHAREIAVRGTALADSLTALDAAIRSTLEGAPQRSFLATHEAWGYFAARYGLHSLGSLYEGPGHEPSARGLAALVDAARGAGLGAVLAEPQMAETAARALAGEVGARVVVVDPLGGPGVPGRESYLDLMRFNARGFAEALRRP
ncbi:MAG: zinc ABC transporter substrate-binding protein [Gemmatimonadota bacterium]